MTREQFGSLFALLRASFPSQPVPDDTFEAYSLILGDGDFEQTRAAMIRVLRTATFWPSPGVIAQNIAEAAANQPDPSTVLAEIREAIHNLGRYGDPKSIGISECAAHVIGSIGWTNLCDMTTDEAMGMNAHILKIAATYRQRAIEEMNFASVGLLPTTPTPKIAPPRPAVMNPPMFIPSPREERTPEEEERRSNVIAEAMAKLKRFRKAE